MLPRRIDLKVGSSSLLRADFCGAPRAAEMRDRSRGWEFEPAKYLFFFCRIFTERRRLLFRVPNGNFLKIC